MQTFAYRKEVLMSRFVTLKDVAERAGTTVGTVSYVLNNKKGRYISDELRQRVLLAASELNYIKCNGASSLKGMDRKLIGILIPQFENQFFTRICLAAEEVFVQHGYDLIICDTFDEPEREKAIIHRLLSQRVDGMIITPTVDGAENTRIARDVGMNMVVVDRPLEGLEGYHWVTTNNYGCGFEGGRYLRDCGHRKIIYIGWKSGIADLDSRETGLRDASAPDAEIYSYYAEFSPESGFAETEKALDDHPDATAVFYGFNIQAKGGVNVFRKRGLSVGEDISVMLIGSPEWAYTGSNDFSRLDMEELELGRKAARLLLDLIKKGSAEPNRVIQDCVLIEGSSVRKI